MGLSAAIKFFIIFLFLNVQNIYCENDFQEEPEPPEEIIIVGSSLFFEQILPPSVQESINKEFNVQLILIPCNSLEAVEKLSQYQASIGIIKDNFHKIANILNKLKPYSIDSNDFEVKEISSLHLVIMLNHSNITKNLSKSQLAKIFSGEITNWEEVNNQNSPIAIYIESSHIGIKNLLEKSILGCKKKITPNVYKVNSLEGLINGVREHENAISYYLIDKSIIRKKKSVSFLKDIQIIDIQQFNKDTEKLFLVVRNHEKDKLKKIINSIKLLVK